MTIFVIFLSISLLNIFYLIKVNLEDSFKDIESSFLMEIFINNDNASYKDNLEQLIKKSDIIEKSEYISKEKALDLFILEYKDSPVKTIGYNPLPSSFRIWVKKDSLDRVNKFISDVEKLNDASQPYESMYNQDLSSLKELKKSIYKISYIVIFLISALSFILVFNTIKITIKTKAELIKIMKLVGATNSTIRRPLILSGLIQAFIASVLSFIFVNSLLYGVNSLLAKTNSYVIENIAFNLVLEIFACGLILGFFGSLFSVNKYLSKH